MTNPPIPPAVVDAMLAPICCDDGKCQKPEACTKDHWRPDVELSLSAALATGSVVICTPELRELLDCAIAAAGALGGSRVNNLRHAANEYTRSLAIAQVSQEPK